ncbi:MAG: pilus assembly protein [Methanobrevibacter sp.]|nr:pilus assembly protein [Methanobrevibacter sp.]
MEIYMQKIGMIRPDANPKNSSLNFDIDWSIDYYDSEQCQKKFCIILRSLNQFILDFKIEGFIELDAFEKFDKEEVSQLIFHRACSVLMDMISLTRQSSHVLSNAEGLSGFGSEYISGTLFS